ncbi:HAD family hydrolase [Rhizobium leguminosarum]
MIIFDFDQTLVDTSSVESLRVARDWKGVMRKAAELPVYPGVGELLSALGQIGHRLAIVTKSPDMVPRWFIKQYGWPIDIVVGYHDVRNKKPHPEGILLAMTKGNAVASDTFHVGDQVQDTEAARAAGIVAIGVTWGLANDRELRESAPDEIFNTVGELKTYFDR